MDVRRVRLTRRCCRCFEQGERYFYCLDVKAGMFRDGHEDDGIFTDDHLLTFHSGDLAR